MRLRADVTAFVVRFIVLAMAGGAFFTSVAAQPDPVMGTWTLNPSKLTFTPGPPLKSATVTFAPAGEGVRVVADLMDAEGVKSHTEYTGNYDGKEYPIKGVAAVDTVSLRRIDATTTERTDKKDGKVVQTYLRKVDPDGKTLTVTQKGTDATGKPFTNVLVFERRM